MDIRDLVVSTTLIAPPTTTAVLAATQTNQCQSLNLPSGGVLIIPGSDPITLTSAAAFRPLCVPTNAPNIVGGTGSGASSTGVIGTSGTEHSETDTVSFEETSKTPQYSDFRDPFYASTFPQCYALAATTIIAYTLVIMLFITPRSFLDGGVVVLGRRGFTNGGSGGKNIGGRPWLQKVAALTVAISMTIATANTFRVAESQYSWGIQNAKEMQDEVLDGTELKVIRIISDTFLWLAQAQTLIRLFPRQREKVIIKWTAFSLVVLDVIFDSLNQFRYSSAGRTFTDAVPALSYLFQLALGVLYAAWVIYYSLMKKRYAFYHPRMRNICLVAVLSLLAILVPVVFFVLDISKPDFTGWGDYVRWVGAAAASVIVWEWVERIEALEREEKKDGILGREVFDGDEMIDMMPSDSVWPRRRRKGGAESKDDDESVDSSRPKHQPQNDGAASGRSGRLWPTAVSTFAERHRLRPRKLAEQRGHIGRAQAPAGEGGDVHANDSRNDSGNGGGNSTSARRTQPPLWPARPPPAVTPISRTDTASADSTVYVMRYHPVTDSSVSHTTSEASPTPGIPGGSAAPTEDAQEAAQFAQPDVPLSRSNSASSSISSSHGHGPRTTTSLASSRGGSVNGRISAQRTHADTLTDTLSETTTGGASTARRWRTLAHTLPFRRGGGAASVSAGSEFSASSSARPGSSERPDDRNIQHDDTGRWDFRARFEDFAATQAEKIRERIRPSLDTTGLPVMVIPAPQRHGAALAQVLEEEENSYQPQQWSHPAAPIQRSTSGFSGSAGTGPGSPGIVMMGNLVNPSGPSSPMWRSNSNASISSAGHPRSGATVSTGSTPLHDGPPAVIVAALSRASSSRDSGSPDFEGPAQSFSPGPSQAALDKRPVPGPPGDIEWAAGPSRQSPGPAP